MIHILRWYERIEDERFDCGQMKAAILERDKAVTYCAPSSYVPENPELAGKYCEGCARAQSPELDGVQDIRVDVL